MKVLIVIAAVLAGTLAIGKQCVPDMYAQGFLTAEAVADPKPMVIRLNSTYYADYKKKVAASYSSSESFDTIHYSFYDTKVAFNVVKTEQGETCKREPLNETLEQCLPDDAKVIAEYTNMAGRKVQLIEFIVNQITVTLVEEDGMPVLETLMGEVNGVAFFTTKLFTTVSTQISPTVFNLPESCKMVALEEDGFKF